MTNYKFQRELLSNILEKDNLGSLLAENWQEVEDYQKEIKLNVDWERYLKIEALGMLGVYTVRTNENKLVGYTVIFADYNLHHSEDLFARVDTFYIDPEHRKYGTALKLLDFVVNEMRALNVSVLTFNVKFKHLLNKVLPRLKFKPIEITHALLLKEN